MNTTRMMNKLAVCLAVVLAFFLSTAIRTSAYAEGEAARNKDTGEPYATLQGAVNAAEDGQTLELLTKAGRIKGVGKGTCKVYVYAHNGVYKAVRVTVK